MEFHSPPTPFESVVKAIAGIMLTQGETVDTGHWQAMENVPQTDTIEIRNVIVNYQIPFDQAVLTADIMPSDPWAELQFQERVGGEAVNPGATYHLWPWFRGNVPKHQDPANGDKFSHTYMERFWARFASSPQRTIDGNYGIRYRYGDLDDVMRLLATHPFTRQAYLPIFFPEDTGATSGQRIPCTLGYHLMRRDNRLHCFYPIRSCDFLRHFRDDLYMASRLVQWVIEKLAAEHPSWVGVRPGKLTFHAHSLHVFAPERNVIRSLAYAAGEEDFVGGAV